ncbi:MAG TPA: hypothetical protein VGY54_15665, partial [Polyangiaceae bacterium]|nr:hypothetical protein [Polyangiaceae bacterium]
MGFARLARLLRGRASGKPFRGSWDNARHPNESENEQRDRELAFAQREHFFISSATARISVHRVRNASPSRSLAPRQPVPLEMALEVGPPR